ncbi:phage tail tape measure protein [Tissierella sp.]|uniref:phage tail tape measure protein n=1 Tax=Tissierella sp. TaxID=41274 RepID=UPI00285FB5D4|nr:phage tail tape measure protein [Tissierella sp.]MDR7856077.1 phage tail tape measure protein [Tissierella sp.]
MNDDSVVKIMQSLGLDYSPAISATERFENRISNLNKELAQMKMLAMQGAKDINNTFSSQLGSMGGQKTILDQFGQPLQTVQTIAKKSSKDISDGFVSATKAAKQHKQSVEEVGNQYNVFSSEWQRRSSWFLSGSLFYGAMKGAKEAISTIAEVEMGMVEISRVMEDSTFVFNNYRDELLQLGVDYGQSFEIVQDIALRWAQAGYGVQDSLDNTKTSLLALNTAELDAKNSTESLIGIMAQWKMTSAELPVLLDKINKTGDDFTVTSQDLVDGLLRSSGAARIMNLSIDETIALLTVMREASGRTGQEVGNALNSILSYIQRPKSIDTLEDMGINMFADNAKTQFRNVMEIFQDIASKWDTASNSIKDGFMESADDANLFSEEMANALGMQEEWNDLQTRDISQASAGVYRRNYFIGMIERLFGAQNVLNGMMDAAGYSQSENARTMDTLEKKYQSLKTSAEQLAVALGDAGLLDVLKGITDTAIDVTNGIASMDDEGKALLLTALELLAISKAIKSVGGMFGVDATLGAALSLPGWTKLLAIIPAVVGAIGLYKSNLDSAHDSSDGLKQKQEELTKSYNSQLQAADETSNSLLEQAKKSETLANKLDELTKKEELNISEKAQMKAIVDQLNQSFPNLSLVIDEQTGKVIGNTTAIYDNIEALKQQAIAQGYQAKMSATASSYVDQELLLGQTRNELDIARSELNSLKLENKEALEAIEKARTNVPYYDKRTGKLNREIADINKQYGLTNVEQEIRNRENSIKALSGLASTQEKLLNELDAELSSWADKATSTNDPNSNTINQYVPKVGEAKPSKTKTSAYKNEALDNALKILDYKKYINEITTEDEINTLNQIKSKHVKTADELMDINKRLYSAEKSLMDDNLKKSVNWISEKKSLNELTVEEEIAAWERVKTNQLNNIEAVKQANQNLYKLRNQIMTESLNNEENSIKHLARLGVLGIEEQIKKYRELYKVKASSLSEEQARVENLFDLYKNLISDQQKTVKDAYDDRIQQIEDESKKKKSAQEDIIKGIEKELELLDRQEDESDHEKKMAKFREELAYWQVRTSEDARKKVADLLKQIDEDEHDREIELKKQGLENKKKIAQDEVKAIEDTANQEKEKWEKSYNQIEIAFDEHSIDMIALASTMSEVMFDKFKENYLDKIEQALSSGDYGSIGGIVDGINDYGNSLSGYGDKYSNNEYSKHDWGMTDADYLKFVANGDKWKQLQSQGFSQSINTEMKKLNDENNALRIKYGRNPDLGEYPEFHTGAKTLSYGMAMFKPGELVFPPDLSIKLEGLISALYQKPSGQSSVSNMTDRRVIQNFHAPLYNSERTVFEDDSDERSFARELQRAISNMA